MKPIKDKPTPKRLVMDIHPKMLNELKMIALKRNETLRHMITSLFDALILEEKKR